MTDTLVEASMKNNMTSKDQIAYWRGVLFSQGTPSDQDVKNALDQVLSNTTIKRACCLGSSNANANDFSVNVRIPIPKNYSSDIPQINKNFGYIDKTVRVPSKLCNGLTGPRGPEDYAKPTSPDYSSPCDDFYNVYCANMRAFYNDEYQSTHPGKTPDSASFSVDYKKECACYNPNPGFPPTFLSPLCLLYPNCTKANADQGQVYLDPLSRKPCPENVTICQQVIDLSNSSAGGNINLSPELNNKCGNQAGWSSSPTSGSTSSPTSGSTGRPTGDSASGSAGSPTGGSASGSTSSPTSGSTGSPTGGSASGSAGSPTSGSTGSPTSGSTGSPTGGTASGSTGGSTSSPTGGSTSGSTGSPTGSPTGGTANSSTEETSWSDNIMAESGTKYFGMPLYGWGIILFIILVLLLCLCSRSLKK
jgi:hypothetical protein